MIRQDKMILRLALARNIRAKITELGIKTLEELRVLSKVSQSMLSTILNAKSSPRVDTISKIANALSCPATDLFHVDIKDVPAFKDEQFLVLYTKYQLASDRDKDLVRRLLVDDG